MSKSLIIYFSRADENGLAICGSQAKSSKAKVEKWL